MAFKEFIETRRSEATRKTYSRVSRILWVEPDALAELARRDKRAAEDQIIRAIVGRRQSDEKVPGRKLRASSIKVGFIDHFWGIALGPNGVPFL